MDYRVELPVFRGPLDLLLYLVKRDEVDVRDIPIARVAEQFKEYLDVLALIDVEEAGDFLVMAATLMEIKTKMLLPRAEEAAEPEEDPRRELVRQLLEYKRFKDAAAVLEARAEEQGLRGSEYYGKHLPITAKLVSLDLNFDDVPPLGVPQEVTVSGAERTSFYPTVESTAKAFVLAIVQPSFPPLTALLALPERETASFR